jgi:hypothetical protein
MDARRRQNEKKFPNWIDLPNGGRKYWYEIKGKSGFRARYVKEVDKNEKTAKFYQEIYDPEGHLIEIHEKFPVDLGHRKVRKNVRGLE